MTRLNDIKNRCLGLWGDLLPRSSEAHSRLSRNDIFHNVLEAMNSIIVMRVKIFGLVYCESAQKWNGIPESGVLTVNKEWTASIVIARCQPTPAGTLRWRLHFDITLSPDITIAIRIDPANQHAMDYYLIPRLDMGAWPQRLVEENSALIDSFRFETLAVLDELAARSPATCARSLRNP